MHHVLSLMERRFPKLNLQPYTLEDVEIHARRHRIHFETKDLTPDILGYYCTRKIGVGTRKKRYIILNSSLDAIGKTFTGLHELGHFFLHVPVSSKQYFYCRRNAESTRSKHDCEADAFALVAMIPMWMLCDLEGGRYHDELHPAMLELYTRRRWLWERYSI
jgi:Zn-dependent peptidase ImmA (M78 family)